MKILINGTGVAGPCLAYWLLQYGFEPVMVEQAPTLRRGGYVIDFWGTGYDVAERMGLIPTLVQQGYILKELRLVDAEGERCGGFSAKVFRELTQGRYVSLPRGDLAAAIYGTIEGRVETIFADSVAAITPGDSGVHVTFERRPSRDFDLVIGADGLHSRTRGLVFGEQADFEHYLGYEVAVFEAEGYRPRDELVYVSYSQPGAQVARFSLRDDRTAFYFVFAAEDPLPRETNPLRAQKARLHERYGGAGWECDKILAALDACEGLYFDRVSQIRMESWWQGRVALLGDAAFCPSLLAGEGSALAMTAAYVLAGELKRAGGDHRAAFARYEERLRPFIEAKQTAAVGFAKAFAPKTTLGLFLRNQISKAMAIPLVANATIGRSLRDDFELPDFEAA